MREDLKNINREEDKIQMELMEMKKKNLHKHHKVIQKNNIDTKIQNTEQLVMKYTTGCTQGINSKRQPIP